MKKKNCVFCKISKMDWLKSNELACAVLDANPVTPFHVLIIPKRHVESYFDLTNGETASCNVLLKEMKKWILKKDPTVTGFNVGVNQGEDAGQTIEHCHIHLIPRRKGDVENPEGGVRHLIAGRGYYGKEKNAR